MNVGAAGTLVVRKTELRVTFFAELRRKLPFETEVAFGDGSDLVRLEMENPFAADLHAPTLFRFVSILSKVVAAKPSSRSLFPKMGSG